MGLFLGSQFCSIGLCVYFYSTVLITIPLQYSLKSEIVMPPVLFFFLRIALAVWGSLWFHIHFKIIFSTLLKNATGVLIGIALNLWMALSSMDISTTLLLPIYEHGVLFHLFVSSLIYFLSVL